MKFQHVGLFLFGAVLATAQVDSFGGLFGASTDATRIVTLEAPLSTLNENPAITDRSATGNATIRFRFENPTAGRKALVQVDIAVNPSENETVMVAHIHRGRPGANGPVVIDFKLPGPTTLTANQTGMVRATFEITDPAILAIADDVIANPGNYYVNAHTQSKPGGLVRGQLAEPALAAARRLEQRLAAVTETDLRDIKRLVIIMAYQQSVISATDRDALLKTLEGR